MFADLRKAVEVFFFVIWHSVVPRRQAE